MRETLACPECGGTLTLKGSRFGPFYGCSGYPSCTVAMGAHPDGKPLGIPGDAATRLARIRAHEAFDALWSKREKGSRKRAYRFLQKAMGLSEEACHIAMFDAAQCERVVEVCSVGRVPSSGSPPTQEGPK